jgi:hypothetical protein
MIPDALPVENWTLSCWARCCCKSAVVSHTFASLPVAGAAENVCELCKNSAVLNSKAASTITVASFDPKVHRDIESSLIKKREDGISIEFSLPRCLPEKAISYSCNASGRKRILCKQSIIRSAVTNDQERYLLFLTQMLDM